MNDPREIELRKLRRINQVLMDRVERDMDAQGGNAYGLFRTAITLQARISERTAELATTTHQLMHEIAERRRAETGLLAATAEAERANLGKTRFLAAATHDLRQPLNAARLFLGALAEEVSEASHRDLLRRVDATLDTIDDLLGALLDISKLDAGAWPVALAPVAIGPILTRLAAEYRPQAHAHGLDLRAVPCQQTLHTDRKLFERVLRNLISNAIRYTAEGRILIGCRHRGDRIAVQVWDSGIGIPEAKRDVIFGEFQRLGNDPRQDGAGVGLGLAIVDRIARLLDLDIELTSVLGRGSCFSVSVARADEADREPAAGLSAGPAALDGYRILVIDNETTALTAVRSVLETWGCHVEAFPSADHALSGMIDVPHLILADYHLDGGALGTDAIARLRRRTRPDIPAIVMSADTSGPARDDARAHGHQFLSKPVKPARLRATISFLAAPAATSD